MNMNNQEKNNYVRSQILNTLLEMMREQSFDSIVISSLTERAQVGRASFYRNYTDKKDVLKQESDRLIKNWGGTFVLDGTGDTSKTLISLLDYMKEHSDFYLTVYQAGMDEVVKETIIAQFPISKELPNAFAYLFSYVAYSVYGWIHEWIKRGMQESGTEIAKMFEEAQKRT